ERAEARQLEADVGAAEIARHVGLAEEIARRVAVVAARDGDEVLAACDGRRVGGLGNCGRQQGRTQSGQRRGDGFDVHKSPLFQAGWMLSGAARGTGLNDRATAMAPSPMPNEPI